MIINLEITDEQGAALAQGCGLPGPFVDGNDLLTQVIKFAHTRFVKLALAHALMEERPEDPTQAHVHSAADAFEAVTGKRLDRTKIIAPRLERARVFAEMRPTILPTLEDPAPIVKEDPAPIVKEDPAPVEGDTPTPAVG